MKTRKAHKVRQRKRGDSPQGRLLIVDNASEVVTVRGENRKPRKGDGLKKLGSIPNGSVIIMGNHILDVGPRDEVLSSYDTKGALFIDAGGKLVMPGFVDAHTHLIFAGSRERELSWKIEGASYREIAERGGGIVSTMNATREASQEELFRSGMERLDFMVRHGTTSLEIKSGYGLRTEDEIKILEVASRLSEKHRMDISSTFLGAHAIPPEFKDSPDAYVSRIVDEMLPIIADRELADFCDVFCEDGFFDLGQSRRILKEGKAYGLIPKLHADELTDLGGAGLAAEVEAISADHLEKSSDTGLTEMAKKNVIGVLLPGTSFSTNLGYPDARHMIDLGVPVALATDFNPNCWTKSMQFIVSLAVYKLRMFPSEALVASTINAAHAIGRANEVGSLEPGKLADIIILNVSNHEQIPYRFAVNHVETVIKRGEVIFSRS
ncbi:MAG: imidazolonepropionase [Thermoplasmata archaeon]